jgi:hypothetical protein
VNAAILITLSFLFLTLELAEALSNNVPKAIYYWNYLRHHKSQQT